MRKQLTLVQPKGTPSPTTTSTDSPNLVPRERLLLVSQRLKELYSASPYYQQREKDDPDFWLGMAMKMPRLPL